MVLAHHARRAVAPALPSRHAPGSAAPRPCRARRLLAAGSASVGRSSSRACRPTRTRSSSRSMRRASSARRARRPSCSTGSGRRTSVPPRGTGVRRRALLALLREGGVRSWRFLEASEVLERSLPELAEAVRRRRADPFVLDPAHVLRFDLVDALRDAVADDPRAAAAFERLRHPEQPMLAAWCSRPRATAVIPSASPAASPTVCASAPWPRRSSSTSSPTGRCFGRPPSDSRVSTRSRCSSSTSHLATAGAGARPLRPLVGAR